MYYYIIICDVVIMLYNHIYNTIRSYNVFICW